MKDMFVLLLLLHVQAVKVSCQPYRTEGKCRDERKEYKLPDSGLCCQRCRPGQRLNRACSEAADSDCVDCGPGLYIDTWNYNNNCFMCAQCRENRGLQYARNCSSATNARCVCQPGMFCTLVANGPSCKECSKHQACKVGYGVSRPGTASSDVRCERCPSGTFSDTSSATDRCRPHTHCGGAAVVKQGNATSDTVCELQTTEGTSAAVHTTARTTVSTVRADSDSAAPHRPRGATLSVRPSLSEETLSPSTNSTPPPTAEPVTQLVGSIAAVLGVVFLLIILSLLLFFCRPVWRRDSARLQPKVDANGNCQSGDEIGPGYLGESQLMTFTVKQPEQQCLLEKAPLPFSEHSPISDYVEPSSWIDCPGSHESINISQSTVALDRPHSALSEPMALQSDAEPVAAPPGITSQSSSQPTSPQVVSPVTPGPHVNVSITLNIGNGSCGAQSCMIAGLKPTDCDLPFGEEEQSFGTPQQEGGKESLMSVKESEHCYS